MNDNKEEFAKGVGITLAVLFMPFVLVFFSAYEAYFIHLIWEGYVADYLIQLPYSAIFALNLVIGIASASTPTKRENQSMSPFLFLLVLPVIAYLNCVVASWIGLI